MRTFGEMFYIPRWVILFSGFYEAVLLFHKPLTEEPYFLNNVSF